MMSAPTGGATNNGGSPTQIKLSDLPIPQIVQLRQDIDQEIKFVQNRLDLLLSGRERFESSRDTMIKLHESSSDEILIPMTQSAYQEGTLESKDRFVMELGAGFYAERSFEQTKKYIGKRLDSIDESIEKFRQMLSSKKKTSEVLSAVLQEKLAAAQKQLPQESETQSDMLPQTVSS